MSRSRSVPATQTTVNLPGLGLGTHWLQVQAIDNAGNQSSKTASARVDLDGSDVVPPSVPRNLVVGVDPGTVRVTASWDSSNDNVAVTAYAVYRNGALVATVNSPLTTATLDVGYGDHQIQVAARRRGRERVGQDRRGAGTSGATRLDRPVRADRTHRVVRPDDPPDDGQLDGLDRSVRNRRIHGVPQRRTPRRGRRRHHDHRRGPANGQPRPAGLGDGHDRQHVRADGIGVRRRSAVGRLSTPPSTPRDLTAVVQPDGSIAVGWTASRDNVAVARYSVTRNAVEVSSVPGSVTNAVVSGLGPGDHYIQVQAFDAAGNASYRTASVKVTILPPPGPDTQNPTTPRDLTAVARADGSVDLAWTASRDNVGVASYRITRNGAEVAVIAGTSTTANVVGLGTGTHYLQVQAFDAAGNTSFKTPSAVVVL